jgi:hypothetical protein
MPRYFLIYQDDRDPTYAISRGLVHARSISALTASSASGVSTSTSAAVPDSGTSVTASAKLAIRLRAPVSPWSVASSEKKRRDQTTGLPRLPSIGREARSEIRVVDEPHVEAAEHRLDPLALVAGDDDDRIRLRGQGLLRRNAHQRLVVAAYEKYEGYVPRIA